MPRTPAGPPSRFIAWVIRWHRWVIALWLALVGASAAVYIAGFRIDNSVAIWFLEDDPELQSYRAYNADFGEREWTYLWLRVAGDTVFEPGFVRDLHELRGQIGAVDHVHRVLAITDAGGIEDGSAGVPRYLQFYTTAVGETPTVAEVEAHRDGTALGEHGCCCGAHPTDLAGHHRRCAFDPAAAVRRALWVTGGSMVKTSIILIGGFLAMSASDFLPSVYFGAFFGVGILLALFADIILLPALLRCCMRRKRDDPPASKLEASRP